MVIAMSIKHKSLQIFIFMQYSCGNFFPDIFVNDDVVNAQNL